MKKLFFALVFGIMLMGLASASISDLGYFSPNTCVQIIQTCSNCSYNNISSLLISNGGGTPTLNKYNPNLQLSTLDSHTYSISFCNTSNLGNYFINGFGDDGGTVGSWSYQFEIGLPLGILLMVMIVGYIVAFLGFFKYRNEWISMAGGMIMAILGIYIISFGFGIYNNTLTLVIGYITTVLGLIALLIPIGEKLEADLNWFQNK